MKKILLIILLPMPAVRVPAQNFDEWFRQNKTQIKYLVQQIAALGTYASYLSKGYKIVESGLTTISDLKSADLNLHQNYFDDLRSVNPSIGQMAEVADILVLQVRTMKVLKAIKSYMTTPDAFTSEEIVSVKNVCNNLLLDCNSNLSELELAVTDNKMAATDDQRLKRIDEVYKNMVNDFSFGKSLSKQVVTLASQRMMETNDVDVQKKLEDIK